MDKAYNPGHYSPDAQRADLRRGCVYSLRRRRETIRQRLRLAQRRREQQCQLTEMDTGAACDPVYRPSHYASKPTETVDAIAAVVDGLDAMSAYLLGNIVKYVDRRDQKGNAEQDLAKANNYAHRLVTGKWRG